MKREVIFMEVKRKALLNILIIFYTQLYNCAPMRAHVLFKVKYAATSENIFCYFVDCRMN